jgi:hypothetical protein
MTRLQTELTVQTGKALLLPAVLKSRQNNV